MTGWVLVFLLSGTWVQGPWEFADKAACEKAAQIWVDGFKKMHEKMDDHRCVEVTHE